jgi:hypothetical protein
VDQESSLFGSRVFILRFLISEIMELNSLDGFPLIPSQTYEELQANSNLTFYSDSEYGNYPVTLNSSSIWKPNGSVDSTEGNVT